jgi:hypothetical protein
MYENGFIYQLLEKTGSFQIIELIPDNPDEVDYIRIELLIDTNLNQIKKLTQFGKNATETTYIINNFAPSIVTDDAFEFKEKNYPGFDIIDLR